MPYRSDSIRIAALWVVLGAGVALAPAAADAVVRIDRVRHSSTADRTRVVLDLSRPATPTVEPRPDSLGVSLVFGGAALDLDVRDIEIDANGVRAVRPRVDADRVTIVFEADARVRWDVFAVPAGDGKPDRVVVDLRASPTPAAVADSAPTYTPADPPTAVETAPASETRPTRVASGKARPYIVAVDAGHGGQDAGAIGRYGLVEKKLCLDIARRVAEIVNRSSNVRAVLTRDGDEYLTLPRRNEVAEQKGADVFVSIHLNSAPSRSARGAEIYFVAPAGAERAANQALKSGDAAHDFGLEEAADDDIVHMLLDVNQQSVLARSELLAESILDAVRKRDLMPTRAVKQKSFSVLRTISMPSVLVEAGFISNNADAKLVKDPDGREKIARAVADGIFEFFRAHPPQRFDAKANAIATAPVVHRVQRGDTLWTLSRKYGTTVSRIRELNGLRASEDLRVGQELLLPPAN
jgi:N-acetylmuramoyl-L-alanine amidase